MAGKLKSDLLASLDAPVGQKRALAHIPQKRLRTLIEFLDEVRSGVR